MDKNHPLKAGNLRLQIGNRLKELRTEKGLTQRELAARVKGGVDYTYIGKIERGEQLPSLKVLLSISEMLCVPIEHFFRDEAETALHTSDTAELGFLLRDKRGRELLGILKLLQTRDIPLIIEIIKILVRHGNIETGQLFAGNRAPAEELLLVAEKKTPFLEK